MGIEDQSSSERYVNPSVAQKLRTIASELQVIFRGLDGKYNQTYTVDSASPNDVIDFINHLSTEIVAMTDGRPRPLDLSHEGYIASEDLDRWAECYEPGFTEVASIGGLQIKMQELKALYKWIQQTINWHESHPTVRPLSKTQSFKK